MRCFNCGNILPDDSLFCQYCGQKLSGQEIESSISSVRECPCEEMPAMAAENNRVALAVENDTQPAKKGKGIAIAIGAIAAAVILLCLGLVIMRSSDTETEEEVDIAAIAESVLYLEVYDKNDDILGTASGFLVNDQTTLVTNYHVIQDAYSLRAWTSDEKESVEIKHYLAYDEVADLAILQCEEGLSVSPVSLSNSDAVKQSEPVYAVGYPLGLANTLSDGIVSSRYEDEYGNDILQVTAAISEGNSGGPLLNKDGKVIGVMCAYYVDGQNLNLAIASNTLRDLLDSAQQAFLLKDWENRPLMPEQEPVEELEPEEPVEESQSEETQEVETKPDEPAETPKSENEKPPAAVDSPVQETPPQQLEAVPPPKVTAYTFLSDWIVANSNTTLDGELAYREKTVLDGLDSAFTLVDFPRRNMICVSMTVYDVDGSFATTFLWLTPTGTSFCFDYVYQKAAGAYTLQGRGTLNAANLNAFSFSEYEGDAEKEASCRELAVWLCEDSLAYLNTLFSVYAVPNGYYFSTADFGFVS